MSPQSCHPPDNCGSYLRQSYQRKQIPNEAVDILLSAVKKSTLVQYNSSFKKWFTFCEKSSIDPLAPSEANLLSFLTQCFKEGASYGTLNTHRSAISHISLNKIGDKPLVSRFLKACFNIRPTQSKYAVTWDVNLVLDYYDKLCKNENMSFKDLSVKCVMLFALCTAQRLHTMSRIKPEKIHFLPDKAIVRITEITKTSGPGEPQPVIEIPKFANRPNVCLYECLRHYVRASAEVRKPNTFLFISYKTFSSVSPQTLGKWIKLVLQDSGVNVQYFSGYSTRHAATSAAFSKGLDIASINRAAGWSRNSIMFAKHYGRPIEVDNAFSSIILSGRK